LLKLEWWRCSRCRSQPWPTLNDGILFEGYNKCTEKHTISKYLEYHAMHQQREKGKGLSEWSWKDLELLNNIGSNFNGSMNLLPTYRDSVMSWLVKKKQRSWETYVQHFLFLSSNAPTHLSPVYHRKMTRGPCDNTKQIIVICFIMKPMYSGYWLIVQYVPFKIKIIYIYWKCPYFVVTI
jgi:hypothetical protein